jgi:glycosyltransferase involved in cell wall biosynthesis
MKKVLLYGDYSRVHWTLAQGLRELGDIDVKVASDGDGWKNYSRDIDIKIKNRFDRFKVIYKWFLSKDFKNNDVIQLISYNPFVSFNSRLQYILFKQIVTFLKNNNDKFFLGAFGDDYYWVQSCLDKVFEYSFLGSYQNREAMVSDDLHHKKILTYHNSVSHAANQYVANLCDNIITGAYSYWLAYKHFEYTNKLKFIPFPINTAEIQYFPNIIKNNKISFLIGIQKGRYFWKGLDWIQPVLNEFKEKYPNDIELIVVENVSYKEYEQILSSVNVVVDQVYSMGQGMNALTSLAKGKIVMTGAEDIHYSLIGENHNKPIINIRPDTEQIRRQLEFILDSRNNFEDWGLKCRKYIEDHHDYIDVAKQYCNVWGI